MSDADGSPGVVMLALVQMACAADPDENLRSAIRHIEAAAGAGAQLVCLPELFRSPYFCQSEDPAHFELAEAVPGPTTDALSDLARTAGVAIIAPVSGPAASNGRRPS